jgi:hypothetical protein
MGFPMRVLVFAVAAASCTTARPPLTVANTRQPQQRAHREPLASIEHEGCYGRCRVFKAVIYRDGTLEYHGERFVKHRGDAAVKLTPDKLAKLEQLFADADYFALADDYMDKSVSDGETVITSYRHHGHEKRVRHYRRDHTTPPALSRLEDGFDLIVPIELLVETPVERM